MLRVLRQYRSMFRRQAFLHWFYGEGMEEQDFLDAETNVYDIAEVGCWKKNYNVEVTL